MDWVCFARGVFYKDWNYVRLLEPVLNKF